MGRILERGKFDFVFFADLLAVPTNYGNSTSEALRRGTQATATIDPVLVATSIAAVTQHLGIAVTKSTTYFHSYEVAPSFATLDHLSKGRVAWNRRHLAEQRRSPQLRLRPGPRPRRALRPCAGVRRGRRPAVGELGR